MRRTSMLAAFLTAALAPSASAGSVELQDVRYCTDVWISCRYMDDIPGVVLRYAGGPSENNTVTVRRSGYGFVITDVGAPLLVGAHCESTGNGTARCDSGIPRLVGYRIEGRDGDDTVTIAESLAPHRAIGQPLILDGGPGQDVLAGGADDDVLIGGPGADSLYGGEGDDRFLSEDRVALGCCDKPTTVADDAAPDYVHGGPGFDTADYWQRTAPLHVRMVGQSWIVGEPAEDRLDAVERIIGGSGDDVIVGGPADDRLEGYAGNDRIDGGGGADELLGGEGTDTLSGGDGDDRLDGAEHATCGRGRDIIGRLVVDPEGIDADFWTGTPPGAVLAPDCERVRWGFGRVSSLDPRPFRRSRRQWVFRNPCSRTTISQCGGWLTLRLPGEAGPLAVARFRKSGLVRARLGPRAARRLARATEVGLGYEFLPPSVASGSVALSPFVIAVR